MTKLNMDDICLKALQFIQIIVMYKQKRKKVMYCEIFCRTIGKFLPCRQSILLAPVKNVHLEKLFDTDIYL